MATNHTVYQNVQLAISAYAKERWTEEKTINSTGMVTSAADIDATGESFIGQMRWIKPIVNTENNISLTDATDGTLTTIATDIANYVKCQRSTGARSVNMASIVTKQDTLGIYASEFARNRAQSEHNAVLSVLKGVAASEAAVGAGVVDFDTVPDGSTGAFIDLNADGEFGAAVADTADRRGLISGSGSGAASGSRLFRAMGMFWKDYEPDYAYLITTPESFADFRAANLIDEDRIRDGNIEFQTLFNGKFRLIMTRADQGDRNADTNVNAFSNKTSFIVKPGALHFSDVPNEMPTEIDRDASAYAGGGTTEIWYRYGFIVHPMGYDWTGATTAFATNANLAAAASWDRKVDPLNLGILPVFHG